MKALLSLVLLAPAGFTQGHVLVVDAAGGGAYTQIAAALQSAAAGDVLLVKNGGYSGFAVANLSVAVVGDTGANVQVNGTVQVRNLGASRTVLLHRLHAFGATSLSPNDGPGITLKNDVGAVRVQDCLAQGAAGLPGVRIEGSGDIALCMTQAFGGATWPVSGEGVLANGSAFAAYECDLQGASGAGPTGTSYPTCHGGSGGSGLRSTTAGFLFVGGTLLVGGLGADGYDGCCCGGSYGAWCNGGNGGAAIDVLAGAQTLWRIGNSSQPGTAGAGGHGMCGCGLTTTCDGDPGNNGALLLSGGTDTLVNLVGASPTFSLSANPVRESTTLGLTVDSDPGDAVLLVTSGTTSFSQETNRGVRLVDSIGPHTTWRLGTTDAQGHLQYNMPIADLGVGVESRIVHMQLLVAHTNGQLRWSNPVSVVLLDSAF